MKKIISLVLALAMVMMVASAMAASITITPPENIDEDAVNTYTIYKIFDAKVNPDDPTIVNYTLPEGIQNPPTGFSKDTAGNISYSGASATDELTATDITNIKTYISTNHISGTQVEVTGREPATFDGLEAGYYFIDTTTGSLVSIKTNNEALQLDDKNSVPGLNKEITGASGTIDQAGKDAISQVGTDVDFTVTITVGRGMKSYKLHDTMDDGLSYNDDITFTYNPAAPAGYAAPTVRTADTTDPADDGDTFTVDFADGLAEGTVITAVYSAKVTNEALTYIPEKNTAILQYGNGPTPGYTPPVITRTYSAKISVVKQDASNNNAPLAGAGFKLYKFDTDGTTKLYYSYNATTKTVTWAASTTDERVTDDDGEIDPFLGLNDGTYYLEESTVPDGYNAPAGDTRFTIAGNDYTQDNLEQSAIIPNTQGALLPSTGGIGTTIFYILGGLLVVGAAVILIARRKAQD